MKTFFETNISKTKTFVLYGNLQDTIWCPDLLPRDIEHYLVKLLKSRGYEHVIFYGEAGTKGAYCLDEESARFFFSPNRDIPLPGAISEEAEQETAEAERREPSRAGAGETQENDAGATGSQVSDALEDLFPAEDEEDDYAPGDISAAFPQENQPANASTAPVNASPAPANVSPASANASTAPGEEHSSSGTVRQRVRYSYRGQTMSEFLQKIHPLMLRQDSRMAVIFYNILTTDITSSDLRDDILDIWEMNSKGNICLLLFPETLYNEAALENRIRQFGLESKFLKPNFETHQFTPNPVNCLRIARPAVDEVKYMLRYLAIAGDEKGNRIKFRYADLDSIADQIMYASEICSGDPGRGVESMSEIYQRFSVYLDRDLQESAQTMETGEPLENILTPEMVGQIYGVSDMKPQPKKEQKNEESGEADWAVRRVTVEIPDAEPEKTLDELLAELDALTGLEKVKSEVRGLIDLQSTNRWRRENGLPVETISLHMVFTGNPGTGKTTVARLIGQIYHAIGVLSRGHTIEASRENLVAPYVGQTAIKTREVIERAKGGVLFIDEAYTLSRGGENDFGQEAIDTLVKQMEDNREDLVVIVAGYPDEMRTFIEANAGLQSRFTKYVDFEDYSVEEMLEILKGMCGKGQYILTDAASDRARMIIQKGRDLGGKKFGNGRYVRTVYETAISRLAKRMVETNAITVEKASTFLPEDFVLPSNVKEKDGSEDEKTTEELLKELDQFIGLEKVKVQVRKLINNVKMSRIKAEKGMKVTKISLHLVFTGNPGTGKTTVARLLAKLYKSIGILETGQLIEVGREDLVGQYVGHTAPKTREVLDRALGGVLFIDEAYTLTASDSNNDYGQEAVDTILRYMENHRDKIVVIVAGYPNEMKRFIESNPGLESRFTTTIDFEDYSLDQLMEILELQCRQSGYVLTDEAREKARERLEREKSMSGTKFGNGRVVRNIFEKAVLDQNDRISRINDLTDEDLMTLTEEDFK